MEHLQTLEIPLSIDALCSIWRFVSRSLPLGLDMAVASFATQANLVGEGHCKMIAWVYDDSCEAACGSSYGSRARNPLMYITIPATASDLSQSALHLLVAVVARAPSGSEVNMTQQDLAVAVKASRSTVQRALLELQQVGLVEVIHRGPGSPVCLGASPSRQLGPAKAPAPPRRPMLSDVCRRWRLGCRRLRADSSNWLQHQRP